MESQPGISEIELQETAAKPFEALLKYIYTGKMNLLDIKVKTSSHRSSFKSKHKKCVKLSIFSYPSI